MLSWDVISDRVDSAGATSLVDLRKCRFSTWALPRVALLYVRSHFPLRITAVEATIGQKCLALINWPLLETHDALQRTNTENLKQIFPEKELRGQSPNFHIHVFESDLYIHTNDLPIPLQEICGPILGI